MGNEFQKALEHDNLEEARTNLNEFTGKLYKKRYERGIEEVDNERLDKKQMGFITENPELTFEEIVLLKKYNDYLKGVK